MKMLVFCLEEPSCEEMLKGLLPKILPDDVTSRFLVFEGKQDLEKQLVRKLRGWNTPNTGFIVIHDQDAADCKAVKEKLVKLCREARKPETLVRVACRELESFYLGDLNAVEAGLNINGLARYQNSRKFRLPDQLGNPSGELEKLTKWQYQKVLGSRAIGPHLSLRENRSRSFQNLVSGIQRLLEEG